MPNISCHMRTVMKHGNLPYLTGRRPAGLAAAGRLGQQMASRHLSMFIYFIYI